MVQRLVSIMGGLATLGLVANGHGQTFDHVMCQKVAGDALRKQEYAVDLLPRDGTFPADSGCTVKAPAKVLCTPVDAAALTPPPPGAAPGPDATSQLCYKVKCRKRTVEVAVADRFGARSIEVKAPHLLCAPLAGPASSSTTTTTTTTPASTTTSTTLPSALPPSPGCPLVNEVMTGGTASGADEFVEVSNPCPTSIDLAGARLAYRSAAGTSDSTLVTWAPGTVLVPGGRLVYGGATFTGPRNGDLGAGLSGTGGGVAIRAATGEVVDSVGYGTATNAFVEGAAAPAPAAGSSIARIPDGSDTDQNGTDWTVTATITPGTANAGS